MDSRSTRRALAIPIALAALAFAAPAGTAHAAYPGKNGKIAFSSNRNGNYDIFAVRADGTGLTQLTDNVRADIEPRWSPDGTQIAFMRSEAEQWGYSLHVMNADGSSPRLLLRFRVFEFTPPAPSWSPDGGQIAYSSGSGGVKIIPAAGGPLQRSFGFGNMALDPAWSPRGDTIAYANTSGLSSELIAQFADGRAMSLTATPSLYETSPAWSPDGRLIVYDDERWIPSDSTGLRTMNADGTGLVRIPGTPNDRDPQWSPDGTRLVVSSWRPSAQTFGLVTLAPDGSRRTTLTDAGAHAVDPDWQALPGPRRADYQNAPRFCAAERRFFGRAAFARRYGGGHTAFRTCVEANH
jgi:Tol biopolymer transport system component